MIFAVIPAGGRSQRMGRPKLALPLGDRSVLEHVIAALRQGGAQEVLVVVGPHVAELQALAERAGASTCELPHETADMRATVEAGLQSLEERYHPAPDDDWLLVPADHPALDPAVPRQLLQIRRTQPEWEIIVPTFEGRRGHPVLLRWRQVHGIREHPRGQGINTYLREQRSTTLEVSVSSPGILFDLDTPEDYERLLRTWPAHAG